MNANNGADAVVETVAVVLPKPKRSHHKKVKEPRPLVKRHRHIFGRRTEMVGGRTFRIEMQADGVHVFENGGTAFGTLNWVTLVYLAEKQSELFDRLSLAAVRLLKESLKELDTPCQ